MAVSGGTTALVKSYAQKYGISRKEAADILNITDPPAATVVLTDAGSQVGSLAWTNFEGMITIEWGDGTTSRVNSSTSPETHTYVAGTYTPRITGAGFSKTAAAQAIA